MGETGVLVVETDPAALATLSSKLTGEGLRVVAAATLPDVLRLVAEPGAVAALVVRDDLRDDQGERLWTQIRTLAPRARVIVHTAGGSYESARAAVNLGAFGYVDAHGDPNELLRTVYRGIAEAERDRVQATDEALRVLALHSPDHIFKLDADGTIQFANRAVPGVTVDEMVGTRVYDWALPETGPAIKEALDRAIATGEVQDYESYNPMHEGEPHWFAGKIRPIVENGVVEGAVLATRRITARKQFELGHEGRSRVLQMLLHHADVEQILDELCQVAETQMPDFWCSVWLLDRHERLYCAGSVALPVHVRNNMPEVLVGSDSSVLAESIRRREPLLVEDIAADPLFGRQSGAAVSLDIRACAAFPIESPTGKIHGTLAVFMKEPASLDSHHMTMLERSAQVAGLAIDSHLTDARVRQLGLAMEKAQAGVACVDEHGCYVAANETYQRMLRYQPGELVGTHWEATVHPADIVTATEGYREMLVSGSSGFEVRAIRKDGTQFMKRVELVKAEGETDFRGHYCTMHDITAQRDAERARDQLEVKLRESQKMQALGQLAGGVAHDFNNLLTVIALHVDSLTERVSAGAPPEQTVAELEQIRQAGDRAASMTRQLLAFSRQQMRHLEVLDLNDVVHRMEDLLRRLLPETIELETRLDPRPCEVEGDQTQLEQVIVNLALNARDAMSGSGVLSIETTAVSLDAEMAAELGVAPGRYACLGVTDTGCGMSPDAIDRAFEPFFTTKPQGHGTGLGLATVYGVVSQGNGVVTIDSEIDQGSDVWVYLPEAVNTGRPEAALPEAGSTAETILLCEDEVTVRDAARRILEHRGFVVLEAEDGVRALQVAARHPGRIDLLLTDVVMPRMNGPELATELRALRPEMPVLFVSGYPHDVALDGGSDESVDFLQKPFSAVELEKRIRRILDLVPEVSR